MSGWNHRITRERVTEPDGSTSWLYSAPRPCRPSTRQPRQPGGLMSTNRPPAVSRRAGSRWRLLVYDLPLKGGKTYGRAHHVSSRPMRRFPEIEDRLPGDLRSEYVEIPDTDFDEIVVGQWLHIEGMDTNFYWMNVGGVTLHVKADSEGRPTSVAVDMPGSYDDPRDGCTYTLNSDPLTLDD